MRARLLHPGFFDDRELAKLDHGARLLFAGLWCIADRAGRLLDSPKRIAGEVFPHEEILGAPKVDLWLAQLTPNWIIRYEANGENFIQIINFLKHQKIHEREKPSVIPECPRCAKGAPKANLRRALGAPVTDSDSEADTDSEAASGNAADGPEAARRDSSESPPLAEPAPKSPSPPPSIEIIASQPSRADIERVRSALIDYTRGGILQQPDNALCRQLLRWARGRPAVIEWWLSLKHSTGRDGREIKSWGWFREVGECELPALEIPAGIEATR